MNNPLHYEAANREKETSMDYEANARAEKYQKYVGAQTAIAQPPTPTVASALGRIEALNERLDQVTRQLAAISDVVGGPRPASDSETSPPAQNGIVYRLNDGANAAHRQLNEIEELTGAIARALG
jgi:hypothetical protein